MQMKSSASRIILGAILLGATGAPVFTQTANSNAADEVNLLKEQIASQQTQIEQLRASMEEMKRRLDQPSKMTPAAQPQTTNLSEVASTTPVMLTARAAADAVPVASPSNPGNGQNLRQQLSNADCARSPLEFRLGDAVFKVGGFVEATTISRPTNVGSGIGTSFGTIPFAHTTAGSLTETRFSPQNSRVSLTFQAPVGDTTTAKFYVESDYLGFSLSTPS